MSVSGFIHVQYVLLFHNRPYEQLKLVVVKRLDTFDSCTLSNRTFRWQYRFHHLFTCEFLKSYQLVVFTWYYGFDARANSCVIPKMNNNNQHKITFLIDISWSFICECYLYTVQTLVVPPPSPIFSFEQDKISRSGKIDLKCSCFHYFLI